VRFRAWQRFAAVLSLAWSLAYCSGVRSARLAYDHARAAWVRGDYAEAGAESAIRRHTRQSPWYWKFQLLYAESLTSQARYAEAIALLQEPVPSSRFPDLEARRLVDRAAVEVSQRRDGSAWLGQARPLATDPELLLRMQSVEGNQLLNRDRNREAREVFLNLAERARSGGNFYQEAAAFSNLAIVSRRESRLEESIEYAVRALAAAEKAGAQRVVASSHGNLGTSYARLGDFDAALAHERKAIQMAESMGLRASLMADLGELGVIYDSVRDEARAIPAYEQAYEMATGFKRPNDAALYAMNLALANIRTRQWDKAAEWNERAAGHALEAKAARTLPYIAQNRGRIAYGRGQFDEARRVSEETLRDSDLPPEVRWSVLDTLAESEAAQHQYASANGHFAEALKIIDDHRSGLTQPQFRIMLLSFRIPFYREYVEVLKQQRNDMEALRVVESSRARVLEEKLGRELHIASLGTPDALKRFAKDAKVSLLSFWCAGGRSLAWLITPAGIKSFDLPPLGEIEALVANYRQVVEHSIQDPMSLPPDLWNRVMAPIADEIPKGSRVIVIPDGPLHRLNLETLVRPKPEAHYWIEDVEIAVAPSIAIAMSKPVAERPEASALLIGDPEYKGTDFEPLPGAASELNQIAACLRPATIRKGVEATPQAYREADPSKFQVIHFAAHAEANVASPLDSAVVLSHKGDVYKLYARDVIDIPIHANLVTLSACRSAGAREYAGEGLIGFAWAFLQAGARSVVAGLWDVSDQSSGPLMSCFYKGIAARPDPVEALRTAKLEMLHGDARFRRPFYWGPFQVYLASAQR
jgi:tetratricopeptide (TPR) repeat protein